jgi:hypothetical protein
MKASIDQFEYERDETPGSIFKNCRTLISNHNRLPGRAFREQGYATGWVRAQLPGQLGRLSFNAPLGPQPIVGKESASRLDISHNGFMPGTTSNVHLLLETQTAIVVLQNSNATIDTADIVAQLILEHLFDVEIKNDYVAMAAAWSQISLNIPRSLRQKLDNGRTLGTKHRDLGFYVGKYFNASKNFFIEVFREGEILKFNLQGSELDTYILRHYHYDAFEWLLTWDGMAKRGRVVQLYAEYFYTFYFEADNNGNIGRLGWAWDPNFGSERETFTRS